MGTLRDLIRARTVDSDKGLDSVPVTPRSMRPGENPFAQGSQMVADDLIDRLHGGDDLGPSAIRDSIERYLNGANLQYDIKSKFESRREYYESAGLSRPGASPEEVFETEVLGRLDETATAMVNRHTLAQDGITKEPAERAQTLLASTRAYRDQGLSYGPADTAGSRQVSVNVVEDTSDLRAAQVPEFARSQSRAVGPEVGGPSL